MENSISGLNYERQNTSCDESDFFRVPSFKRLLRPLVPKIFEGGYKISSLSISFNFSLTIRIQNIQFTIYWTWNKVKLLPWVCHILHISNDLNSFLQQYTALTWLSFKVQNSMLFVWSDNYIAQFYYQVCARL